MQAAADREVRGRWDLVALAVCLVALALGCGVAMVAAWGWPLVGDSSLMRYVVMLLHAGRRPYSEIVEINLPGSYLLEYGAMQVFGWGARGLRLYDGFLCVVVAVAAYRMGGRGRRDGWFCLAGGLVLVLAHLQDGLEQGGQRDFALAALLLCSVAVLARAERLAGRLTWPRVLGFELLVGASLTIKPTLILLAFAPLLMRRGVLGRERWRVILAGVVGLAAPAGVMFLWLWREGSVGAFVGVMRSIGVLHGELGRKSLGFLLSHCTSPVLGLLVLGAGALVATRREWELSERLLLFAAGCGLVSYLYQGKSLPYQRYPFLAAALVLAFLGFSRALQAGIWARGLAFAGMAFCVVWVVPRSVVLVRSFDAVAPFEETLGASLAGSAQGSVQCLDTYGGCVNTLYDLRIEQATGYLYDCYGFTGPSKVRDRYREEFLRAFLAARPRVVVLTDQQCFVPGNSFGRIAEWPELAGILGRDYVLSNEWHAGRTVRWWSRAEVPNGFRVYLRR